MKFSNFTIGMRNVKTAIAVFCCLLFFHIAGHGSAMIASLSAVFAMREDIPSTIKFGRSRILGNASGGVGALIFYFVSGFFPGKAWPQLVLIPIIVMLVIAFSNSINNNDGIIGAMSTLLMITLSIPHGETFIYTFNRVLDTFIGTLIAIAVNSVIKPRKETQRKEIERDLSQLSQEKEILTEMKERLDQDQKERS